MKALLRPNSLFGGPGGRVASAPGDWPEAERASCGSGSCLFCGGFRPGGVWGFRLLGFLFKALFLGFGVPGVWCSHAKMLTTCALAGLDR